MKRSDVKKITVKQNRRGYYEKVDMPFAVSLVVIIGLSVAELVIALRLATLIIWG